MNDSSLFQDFILEAGERIEEFESVWLSIRPGMVERERLDEAFRPIHTIKSSSAYLGLARIGELSHEMENLLDIIRKHGQPIHQEVIDTLLNCSDRISRLIQEVTEVGNEKSPVDDLIAILNQWVEKNQQTGGNGEKNPIGGELRPHAVDKADEQDSESEVYEEPYDRELFSIFLEQLKTGLSDIRQALDDLMKGEPDDAAFHRVFKPLASLHASANYMGYTGLCRFYDRWSEGLRSISCAPEAERQGRITSFIEDDLSGFVNRIGAFFPGAGILTGDAASQEFDPEDTGSGSEAAGAGEGDSGFSEALFKDLLADIFDDEPPPDAARDDFPDEELCLSGEGAASEAPEGEPPSTGVLPSGKRDGVLLEFVEEAREHLDDFEAALMHLSQSDTHTAYIEEMFRCAHTLKGSARYLGHDAIAELAHQTESVLERVRNEDQTVSGPLLDLLISIHDRLQLLTDELMKTGRITRGIDDLIDAIAAYEDAAAVETVMPDPSPEALRQTLEAEAEADLLKIFMGQLNAGISKIANEINGLSDSKDFRGVLERCGAHVADLKSSANYMGYDAFTQFYDNWALALCNAANGYDPSDPLGGADFVRSAVVPRFSRLSEVAAHFSEDPTSADETPKEIAPADDAGAPVDLLEAFVAAPHQFDIAQISMTGDFTPVENDSGNAGDPEAEDSASVQYPFGLPTGSLAGALDQKLADFVVPNTSEEKERRHLRTGGDPEPVVTEKAPESRSDPAPKKRPEASVAPPAAGPAAEAVPVISRINRSIRVDAAKIDTLMNQVGELVVNRAALSQLHIEMKEVHQYFHHYLNLDKKDIKQLRSLYYKLGEAAASLGRVANDLQEGVMKVRMMPISHLFDRYPRLVHDLTRSSGKQVRLEVRGEETELDKMVIERIADPMVHIIRNAVDHGIEPAREREALGKPAAGSIRLNAYHDSNHIVIDIMDDGRGLTLSTIREKAVALGMVSREILAQMTAREIFSLIMNPGFSTAEKVTHTSGRGVGMDVVKKNIEKLNGSIEIDSSPGEGTRFRIKIPLTLAIFPALLVRVADELYTIPLSSVDETIGISPGKITTIEGIEVIHLRDTPLPLLRLSSIFSLASEQQRQDRLFVVVVSTGSQRVGLVVDALVGQEEVVIKPLEDYLQENSGFSGATILGDGRISLILDVYELVNIFMEKKLKTVAAAAA